MYTTNGCRIQAYSTLDRVKIVGHPIIPLSPHEQSIDKETMTINNPKQFHERVRIARLEAELKQEQVARYLKIPVSAVSAFESGNRKIDSWELYRLSRLYQKPLDWFFGEDMANINNSGNGRHAISSNIEDPVVRECFHLLETAPKKLQRSAAYGVIGFLSER